jgi:hypothetical protein
MQAMTELIENEHPLNRFARKKLEELGEYPEPELLHTLHLAQWAVENAKVDVRKHDLMENLELLLYQWKPKDAQEFLLVDEDGELITEHQVQELENLEPVKLAVWILDQLHCQLTWRVPGYSDQRMSKVPLNFL